MSEPIPFPKQNEGQAAQAGAALVIKELVLLFAVCTVVLLLIACLLELRGLREDAAHQASLHAQALGELNRRVAEGGAP